MKRTMQKNAKPSRNPMTSELNKEETPISDTSQKEQSSGVKFDANKPSLELLPPSYWIERESKFSILMSSWYFYRDNFPGSLGFDAVPILEFGKKKYSAHNWFKGMRWGRLVGAFHRHCNKLVNGIWIPRDLTEFDEESGLEHGRHSECCRIFLMEYFYAWCLSENNYQKENDCPWNHKT